MNELTITIPGKPIAQARPRFARRGKFVHTYSTQDTEAGLIRWTMMSQFMGEDPIPAGVPIHLEISFWLPIPASLSAKKRISLGKHVKKPDLTNLVKMFEDCANGILWVDDSQICSLTTEKGYSETPRTEARVSWEEK